MEFTIGYWIGDLGKVIGPKGKTVKMIQRYCSCSVRIDTIQGRCRISGGDDVQRDKAKTAISWVVNMIECAQKTNTDNFYKILEDGLKSGEFPRATCSCCKRPRFQGKSTCQAVPYPGYSPMKDYYGVF